MRSQLLVKAQPFLGITPEYAAYFRAFIFPFLTEMCRNAGLFGGDLLLMLLLPSAVAFWMWEHLIITAVLCKDVF